MASKRWIPWALVGLMTAFSTTYVWRMFADPNAHPSSATWLIFGVATAMVVASYRKAGKGDVVSGTMIFVDTASTWLIFGAVIIHSGFALRFLPFEMWYLAGSLAIAAFWLVTRNHRIANLLVQGLIAVGYLPTFHTIVTEGASEPLYPWMLTFVASICGIVLADSNDGTEASRTDQLLTKVYAWRSFICVAIVIGLVLTVS